MQFQCSIVAQDAPQMRPSGKCRQCSEDLPQTPVRDDRSGDMFCTTTCRDIFRHSILKA